MVAGSNLEDKEIPNNWESSVDPSSIKSACGSGRKINEEELDVYVQMTSDIFPVKPAQYLSLPGRATTADALEFPMSAINAEPLLVEQVEYLIVLLPKPAQEAKQKSTPLEEGSEEKDMSTGARPEGGMNCFGPEALVFRVGTQVKTSTTVVVFPGSSTLTPNCITAFLLLVKR